MMKIKLLAILTCFSVLSACASSFTSIDAGKKENEFFLTNVQQAPFAVLSELYQCEARNKSEMDCKKISK